MKTALQSLTGFKKYLTAFALGAVLTLGLPPLGLFPVIFLCVPAFILLAQSAPTRARAFLTGWAFGAGYFIFGLYWVSAALFVDIDTWGWVLPFSLVAGPSVLGLFYAAIPAVLHSWRDKPQSHAVLFVVLWSLIEYARGHVLTGFPWNLPGQVWHHILPVLQTVSLTGIYGLTLLTLLWAAVPVLYQNRRLSQAVCLSFLLLASMGIFRLMQNPTTPNGEYQVRIVQPNLPQSLKWSEDEDWRNLERHTKLSRTPGTPEENPPPRFIVWPETAARHDMHEYKEIAEFIGLQLPRNSIAVFGNIRATFHPTERFEDDVKVPVALHNGLTAIDRKGAVLGTYDKHHLVPFGEYIPFRNVVTFKPLAMAISGIGDFTPGDGPKTLRVADMPAFSPLICYEVIFPREVVDAADRPEWLLNVTNDGWYGRTAGPYQHLAISRLRAIEEGLPLVRAANTGISTVIDPVGRIVAELPLQTEGALDSALPKPLPATLYAVLGDAVFWALAVLLLGCGLYLRRKEQA